MGVYICRLQTRRISRCVIMCEAFDVFTVFCKDEIFYPLLYPFEVNAIEHEFIHYLNLIQSFINLTHQRKQKVIRFRMRLLILRFEECRLNALLFVIELFECKQTTNDAV